VPNEERTALVFSDYSAGHETGSHPENETRIQAIRQRLQSEMLLADRPVYSAEPVAPEVPCIVHHESVVERVQTMVASGGGMIDGDTIVSPGSLDAGLAAVGAAIRATDLVLSGEHRRAFAIARPPGHHAERSRQMGFCLFNSIAIAAASALQTFGLDRIAILDWDVHHGNGTQDIFYESNHVFFCSMHQWPLFPGSGLEHERGTGSGEGFTLNLPLPAGTGDNDYLSIIDNVVAPAFRDFQPELIMVSAGFDAHIDDPLSMMAVSETGFGAIAHKVGILANELTNGQLVLVLEGGYNLRALSDSLVAVLRGLDEQPPE
jgi:acetoin utilization deacetylase AcuC-like enzyme